MRLEAPPYGGAGARLLVEKVVRRPKGERLAQTLERRICGPKPQVV